MIYEKYHLPECYTQGEELNFDPLHLQISFKVENIRVKRSEKWLLSLRNRSEKWLVSLCTGSEKWLASLRNGSENWLVSLRNAVTETD